MYVYVECRSLQGLLESIKMIISSHSLGLCEWAHYISSYLYIFFRKSDV